MYIVYNSKLKNFSRKMRSNPTAAELQMWNFLKTFYSKFKFLKQKPLDSFILDFYCKDKNLIIEVDGEVHTEQKEKDSERDNLFLVKYKLNTIRFTNKQVLEDRDFIRKRLDEYLH